MTPIELLSPAKNADYGKAAILCGADAVYIGAPRFGARTEASNTIADIEQLVRFARLYNAKVYAAVNTVLYDNEMEDAVRMIRQLYEVGVNALIIQDLGLLQHNLPPLPLFASTQTHNHSPEKIAFLEKVGFRRVILARELGLSEIEEIRKHTDIELECFVHGALCVSYSGQCYMGHAVAGRGGNRGACAQPCRSAYRLSDADGKTLIEKAHLLSLKDLNLSERLFDLIRAGVTSFKIEGRLKDLSYVKNITAFYRRRLDEIIENDGNSIRASSGKTELRFTPDPHKTFNRGYTDYFIDGRKEKVASPQTQKSIGERLGTVTRIHPRGFEINTRKTVNPGDGLCWFDPQRGLEGVLVNKAEGTKIFPAKPVQLKVGTEIYRNNDFLFEKLLSGDSADRRIAVSFELKEHESGYMLCAEDEDGNRTEYSADVPKISAKDASRSREQIDVQLRKLGNTIFMCRKVVVPDSFDRFIPAAELNEMRRQTIRRLEDERMSRYRPNDVEQLVSSAEYPTKYLDYRGNAANRHAKEFYHRHGVEQIDDAFELQNNPYGKVLMTTKHCIKYQYDACPVKQHPHQNWKEPLYLNDHQRKYRLEFDCRACVMRVILV